jgi:prepilin-type N-terminal cleavage/methylation domain-containing protein
MTAKHRRGFTLVELLVVISIIALLISILLPSLKKARDQAKRTVCASRLKSISTALWNYWTENEGRVPYVVSPMNDGEATVAPNTLGFDSTADDDELDPFNRFAEETPEHKKGWPMSLPNVLMPTYLGSEDGVFVCPAAVAGWPRNGEPYRMTFRPAASISPTARCRIHPSRRLVTPIRTTTIMIASSSGFSMGGCSSRPSRSTAAART